MRRVGDHRQEHDVALRALEGRAVAAQDRVALHHFLADGLRELGANQVCLLGADQGDDPDRALLHVGPGRERRDLVDDHVGLRLVDLPVPRSRAVRQVDVHERRVQSLGGRRYPQRQHLLGVELHGEADDRLDAAEVLLQHQPLVGEHRPHQVVDALAGLQQAVEREAAEVVVTELADLLLRNEGCGRAHLPVVAHHDDLLPAQQRRQLGDVGLRRLVDDDQL